jgi:2,3-bisphosphoglycerate-dependent phosphoglycerate mutase
VELILVRHALPVRVAPGSAEGPADPGLSPEGWRQAECLAAWLADERIDAVYTSPMARARETAFPLERLLGATAVVRTGLTEWDRGFDYYLPMEEQKATGHADWQVLVNRDWDAMPIDVFAFRDEVTRSIDAIAQEHPGETVAVVCHGGVINVYASAVLGLADPLFFEPEYSGFSRLLVSRGGVRSIKSLNEAPHLR